MTWMHDHWQLTGFLLVTALCLISLALGVLVGKAISLADRAEQPEPEPWMPTFDTQEIDWDNRPAVWK